MKKFLEKAIPKLYGFYFNLISILDPRAAGKKALDVFSIPRRGRLNDVQKEFLNTARHQRIAFEDGLFMLYHWKGDGPTILLLHGWESNSFRWAYLHPELIKRGFNIIAIDAPAHGATNGKKFTAIKYAGIIGTVTRLYEPEIIMAHSVGAMATSFHLTQHDHSYLKKLILLGSPDSLEVIMKGYQDLLGFNKRVYSGLETMIYEQFSWKIEDFKCSEFVKAIHTPTLIIHNKNDKIVGPDASETIHNSMPNSEFHITETGGHSLHTPENTEHIMAFLEK